VASKYYENWDIATPERSKKSTWSPNPGTPTLDQPKGPSLSLEAAAARALNRATSIVSYARFGAPHQRRRCAHTEQLPILSRHGLTISLLTASHLDAFEVISRLVFTRPASQPMPERST
jgi:hypothetical protein